MNERLLLCTDMDRTVIPNGMQPEHPQARRRFRAFCKEENVTLVYVTGRHRQLVEKAVRSYQLPQADYVISDVGTKIYQYHQGWNELSSWKTEIDKDWHGFSHQDLKQIIKGIKGLKLQELSKQNTHKLSYYLPLYQDKTPVIDEMQQRLRDEKINASVIWSIDELTNIGLIDVLPKNATKLHAIQFLQTQLGYQPNEVVFAGDSGNDMPVLASDVQSILVNNASAEIKSLAYQLANDNDNSSKLFIAGENGPLGMNGNYSAGVLQGIWHYSPAFRTVLQTETFYD